MGSKRKRNFSSEKRIKDQMKQFLEQIGEKITEINKDLLTVADVEYKKSELGVRELVLSWRSKKPAFISPPSFQKQENLPTAQKLVNKIDKKLLTDSMGIVKCSYAAPSLLQNYGFRLVVHRRPKLHLIKENEDFEKFLERRVAIIQVAVCGRFHFSSSGGKEQ
ncbi:unnamed protein product [Arabidopsis halleri]